MSGKDISAPPGNSAQGFSLILGSGLSVMALIALAPVLPRMIGVFGDVPNVSFWGPALVSVSGLSAALFAPFAGSLGDRFGRRIPLAIFCGIFAIAGALPFVLGGFVPIFLCRIVVGLAYMGVFVLSTALIGDLFNGQDRSRWMGFQAMVATFSAMLILPLSGLLAEWFDWRGPFLMFLVALPLAFTYLSLVRDPSPGATSIVRVPWSALPWRWLLGICALSHFGGMLFYAVQLQIGLAMTAMGVTNPTRIALLSTIAMIGVPTGALLFIKVASRPFGQLIRLELFVTGATLMVMGRVGDVRILLAAMFVNMMSSGMLIPTLVTCVSHRLDATIRARGIGVWQCSFSMGAFVSVAASGLLMRRANTTVLDAFWILGVGGVLAAIGGWLVAARNRAAHQLASG